MMYYKIRTDKPNEIHNNQLNLNDLLVWVQTAYFCPYLYGISKGTSVIILLTSEVLKYDSKSVFRMMALKINQGMSKFYYLA